MRELHDIHGTTAGRLDDVRRARAVAGERFAAVLETVLLRRRAAAKLRDPQRWLLTDAALQQASVAPVAEHRAARLRGRRVHDVTCSIGADLAAFGTGALGSDLDPVRLAMARHNCRDTPLLRADALHPVSRGGVVFADPGRRDGTGKRTWRAAELRPPLHELAAAYAGRDLVVKCAPGMDFAAAEFADEVEVVSLERQAREACLWVGSPAMPGVRRSATVLARTGPSYRLTDAEPDDCPVRPVDEWLVDPDPAIVRAGLVRQYAAAHGLAQLDERIAYLTGDRAPAAGGRAFRVREQLPLQEKRLRAALAARGAGRLEILARGVDIDPDTLRRKVLPRRAGSEAATVIVTRIGETAVAYLCDGG